MHFVRAALYRTVIPLRMLYRFLDVPILYDEYMRYFLYETKVWRKNLMVLFHTAL